MAQGFTPALSRSCSVPLKPKYLGPLMLYAKSTRNGPTGVRYRIPKPTAWAGRAIDLGFVAGSECPAGSDATGGRHPAPRLQRAGDRWNSSVFVGSDGPTPWVNDGIDWPSHRHADSAWELPDYVYRHRCLRPNGQPDVHDCGDPGSFVGQGRQREYSAVASVGDHWHLLQPVFERFWRQSGGLYLGYRAGQFAARSE